jgi:hypothetical protein
MHTVVQRSWSVGQLAVADLIFSKRRRLFRVWASVRGERDAICLSLFTSGQ